MLCIDKLEFVEANCNVSRCRAWIAVDDKRKNHLLLLYASQVTQTGIEVFQGYEAAAELLNEKSEAIPHGITTDSGGPYRKFRRVAQELGINC